MAISHVLRGEDHITNTPRQLMVYEAFEWTPPEFGHMTLIVNDQRKKLSKRDESIVQFIQQYDELGYLPEALFNFITLLGWSPEGEEEIFGREQLIEIFNANRLSKSPAVFDTAKLSWLNQHYLKQAEPERVLAKFERVGEPVTLPRVRRGVPIEDYTVWRLDGLKGELLDRRPPPELR